MSSGTAVAAATAEIEAVSAKMRMTTTERCAGKTTGCEERHAEGEEVATAVEGLWRTLCKVP